jgi:hypothetical protein
VTFPRRFALWFAIGTAGWWANNWWRYQCEEWDELWQDLLNHRKTL